MSMALHSIPDISQATWVEMKTNVRMRYEVNRDTEVATLYFGFRDEYAVNISRQNLEQLLHLGAAAHTELSRLPRAE